MIQTRINGPRELSRTCPAAHCLFRIHGPSSDRTSGRCCGCCQDGCAVVIAFKSSRRDFAVRRRIPILRHLMSPTQPDMLSVTDPTLATVRAKVLAGEPLAYADGVALYRSRDLHGV